MDNFWQLEDELRGEMKVSDDHQWFVVSSKLAELMKTNSQRTTNLDILKSSPETSILEKVRVDDNKFDSSSFGPFGIHFRLKDIIGKNVFQNVPVGNSLYLKNNGDGENFQAISTNSVRNTDIRSKYGNIEGSRDFKNNNTATSNANCIEKRFKALPVTEMLPKSEVLGGYIFVCNNDTMQEDLKRRLFGLPSRYKDSVRAITPGLPLFLYNYTTHQLHGIFEATSFGGSNIDPIAWEDKKCKGESRFPAQVRIRVRKVCKPLEEDSFRPVLHHYDGPKFRLELSIPEALQILDLLEQQSL